MSADLHLKLNADKSTASVYYQKKYLGNIEGEKITEVLVQGHEQDQKTIAALAQVKEKPCYS